MLAGEQWRSKNGVAQHLCNFSVAALIGFHGHDHRAFFCAQLPKSVDARRENSSSQ